MTHEEEVIRARAIIEAAMRENMFPGGAMPEDDASKLVEAERLVTVCRQAEKVALAVGPTKVQNYPAVMSILAQADMFVGVNGDGATQPPAREAQPSLPSQSSPQGPQPLPASPSQAPTTSASETPGRALTPSPAASSSSSSLSPSPPSTAAEQAPSVASHPVDPDGVLAEPHVNEEWEGSGGGRWFVLADQGPMVEVLSRGDNSVTVVPKGFLKKKVTEAFLVVEVDHEWNIKGAKGYNALWYLHPGCARWFVPLDDTQLPDVGRADECANCDLTLPIMSVEPNGYVARPIEQAPQPGAMIGSEEAQGGGPAVPEQPTKLNEIHLTAHPDRSVKTYEHPGCSSWDAPLGGKPLLPVGTRAECPTCHDQDVPLTRVEPNGYDPATYEAPAPQQPVFSSAQQAVVNRDTLQPVQEAPPSPQPPPVSPASPSTSAPQVPGGVASQPSSSTERSTGAPVEHDEGDAEYRRILDQADADFLPLGMPAPQDLEDPPPAMPEDLTANPEANRELHSKFNALAARARYLAKLEERVARDCGRAVRLRLRPHMAKAKKELGASSTLTERREWAEEIGGKDVELWLERQKRHADRAEAYGELFSIYTQNVAVLSRDLTWAQNEERGS